jgi:hypothetical protein
MASNRLKFGGILTALGLVLLILMMRSPAPESESEGTARDSGAGSAHDRQSGGNLGDVSRPDWRSQVMWMPGRGPTAAQVS